MPKGQVPDRQGGVGRAEPPQPPAKALPRSGRKSPAAGPGPLDTQGVVEYITASRIRGCSRSEEHTSELQSLMRISYAVFCLKKKKIITKHNTINLDMNNRANTKINNNYIQTKQKVQ